MAARKRALVTFQRSMSKQPLVRGRIRRKAMSLHFALQPILALIAGILILVMPRLLNYIVGIFLIVFGILGLIH
jgi:uncharacterized membrane protein HdeD (DUF308 family)